MIALQSPNPPREVLRRLEDFGADWRESKLPADLRRAGVLGASVAVDAGQFRMRIQAARRSPEWRLHGVVTAAPNGGSDIYGRLELSSVNRVMMVGIVLIIGTSVWYAEGSVAGVIALGAVTAAIAGLNRVGRTLGEREYRALLEQAVAGIPTQPPNDR